MQKQLWEPEHDPAIEEAIYLAREEEHFASILLRERMYNIFRSIHNAAHIASWRMEAGLKDFREG